MLQDGMIEPSGLQCMHGGSRSHTGSGKHQPPCVDVSNREVTLETYVKKDKLTFSQSASLRLIPDPSLRNLGFAVQKRHQTLVQLDACPDQNASNA